MEQEKKRLVFLIDLSAKEDRQSFLKERKEGGRFTNFIFDKLYRIPPKIRRYILIDRKRCCFMLGTDSEICPMGKYTNECLSITGGAITLKEYFMIDDVLKKCMPTSKKYVLKWNKELTDMLESDGFKFWHRPYFGMYGRTHTLFTVDTMNQTVNDSAPIGSENISTEKFIELYKEAKNQN